MRYEDAAGGLLGALLAVKPPGPGVCRVCCTAPARGFPTCVNCHRIRPQLSRLTDVWPISLTTKDHQLYDRLKAYKSATWGRARREVAGVLGLFLERHAECIGGFDLVTWVPSTSGRHRDGHPLGKVVASMRTLAPLGTDVLTTGPGALDRGVASDDAFVCTGPVTGRRVLLVEDTYVSGAHHQSAAAALWLAGAEHVAAVAVGRLVEPSFSPESRALIDWASHPDNPWDPDRCARCSSGQLDFGW